MRRLILLAIAVVVFVLPVTASAATKPVPGTMQVVAHSDYPLKGKEVSFDIVVSRNKHHLATGTRPNLRDGQVAATITGIRAGDEIDITVKPNSIEFGNKRYMRHVVTKTEARLGYVMDIELPYVQLIPPAI